MAPRAVHVFAARCAAFFFSAAALACTVRAPEVFFSPFIFLEVVLLLQLIWHGHRLMYDGAQVFLQVPLPPQLMALTVLVAADWVAAVVLFAAASSSGAVVVFLEIDIRACERLPVGACSHWHRAASSIAMVAWFFSGIVCLLMFWIRASEPIRQD